MESWYLIGPNADLRLPTIANQNHGWILSSERPQNSEEDPILGLDTVGGSLYSYLKIFLSGEVVTMKIQVDPDPRINEEFVYDNFRQYADDYYHGF
jgi:hypothetical protein